MMYTQRAMELYTTLETSIVNSCLPQKYKMDLYTWQQVQEDVTENGYLEYNPHDNNEVEDLDQTIETRAAE